MLPERLRILIAERKERYRPVERLATRLGLTDPDKPTELRYDTPDTLPVTPDGRKPIVTGPKGPAGPSF